MGGDSGGIRRSQEPAYAAAVEPLKELQLDLYDLHKEKKEEHEKAVKEWKAKPKDERGPEPEEPQEPPTFLTGDTTIEALGELLRDNSRGLLATRDELDGWFQSLTRY